MGWPPHPARKHPQMTPEEARSRALVPFRFKPGQSGNPEGLPRSRREQLATLAAAALEMSPEMLAIAADLARHSPDDRVKTRCAELVLAYGVGRPREAPPPETVRKMLERVAINVRFVTAETAAPPLETGSVIDVEPEPSVSHPEPRAQPAAPGSTVAE